MKLAYCFTIRIMREGRLEFYKKLLEKSIYSGMRFHSVTLYTDKETLPHLNHIQCKKVLVDTDEFYYLDDFKIHLLSVLDNDVVLVDTDVIFWHKLNLPDGYDMYADRTEDTFNENYSWNYQHFLDRGVLDIYPQFLPAPPLAPNIGILYFNNQKLKSDYIQLYHMVRKWLVGGERRYNGSSIILGQYLLATLIQSGGYNVYYLFNTPHNLYDHHCGEQKFKTLDLDNLDVEFSPKKWV